MKWQGKDLNDYTKEELMLIMEVMMRAMRRQSERHVEEIKELLFPKED